MVYVVSVSAGRCILSAGGYGLVGQEFISPFRIRTVRSIAGILFCQ